MSNRTLIAGYYGMMNTGDDCLLTVTAWGLKTCLKMASLFATTASIPNSIPPGIVTPIYAKKERLKEKNRLADWLAALRSGSIIFGGGSVFHSMHDLKRKMELLKLSGRGPHYAVGVSLGPFRDKNAEKYCVELLKRLSFVGLRDQQSIEIARSMPADIHFKKTFDLATLLPLSQGIPIEDFKVNRNNRYGIGIALCDYERYTNGCTYQETKRRIKIIEAINALPESLIDEIVLIDFNGHPLFGDTAIHTDIRNGIMGKFKTTHISYNENPLAVLKQISTLRLLVSMRLHASIFSFITQTPVIIMSYHPKCRGWAEQIALSDRYILDSTDFDAPDLKDLIIDALSCDYAMPKLDIKAAEDSAMLNFDLSI